MNNEIKQIITFVLFSGIVRDQCGFWPYILKRKIQLYRLEISLGNWQ